MLLCFSASLLGSCLIASCWIVHLTPIIYTYFLSSSIPSICSFFLHPYIIPYKPILYLKETKRATSISTSFYPVFYSHVKFSFGIFELLTSLSLFWLYCHFSVFLFLFIIIHLLMITAYSLHSHVVSTTPIILVIPHKCSGYMIRELRVGVSSSKITKLCFVICLILQPFNPHSGGHLIPI